MGYEINASRVFTGRALESIRFPLGGVGAGCVNLTGRGGLEDWQIDGTYGRKGPLPRTFGSVFAYMKRHKPVARLLEARRMPPYPCEGEGEGLPRMESARFRAEFPFAWVAWEDRALRLGVELEAFSPFVPCDVDHSAFPAAVLRYRLTNEGDERARVTLAWSVLNLAGDTNTWVDEEGVRGILLGGDKNSMALLTPYRGVVFTTHLLRAAAAPALREFWDVFAATGYMPYHEYGPAEDGERDAGAVGVRLALKPGASKTVVFYLTWHFPEIEPYWPVKAPGPVRQAYAEKWRDALGVGQALHARLNPLESKTRAFHDALFGTSAPAEVLEAAAASIGPLRTPALARTADGVRILESAHGHSTGADAMAFTQSLAFLFPPLQRAAWETAPRYAHTDGLLAAVPCICRDWKLSGDDEWLEKMWPHVKTAMQDISAEIDPEGKGIPGGALSVAGGARVAGASPLPAFLYLAALAAGAEMAGRAGELELAERWRGILDRGQRAVEERLWNGRLYLQAPDEEEAAPHELTKASLSTALLGEWLLQQSGLGGVGPGRHVRRALRETVERNWREDLAGHANPGRAFAVEGEPGLLMCTWPRGARPGSAPAWADEVWPEAEFVVAAHCLFEGLVEEAYRIVRGNRRRHDGERRNPWGGCESEMRRMAGFSLIPALSGFRFDRGSGALGFAPRVDEGVFRTFWSVEGAWGVYMQARDEACLAVAHGKLVLNRLDLPTLFDAKPWQMTLRKRRLEVRPDRFGSVTFRRAVAINAGWELILQR